jgi:hypothetical protein
LTTGGFFPSDQTFVTLAVRVWTYFRFNPESPRANAAQAQQPIGSQPQAANVAGVVGTVTADRIQRVHKLYHQAENQLFWQFVAGDKPQLTTFTAYTPAAGGLDGFFADTRLPRANNGVPTSSALMRLARPILVPPRQGFQVIAIASPIGQATGASIIDQLNGAVSDLDPVSVITSGVQGTNGLTVNGSDDIAKDVKYLIDGIHSRDVL